ncbi:MAG: hypothetical protein ACYC4L_18930 [Chloroflexota bacterium]
MSSVAAVLFDTRPARLTRSAAATMALLVLLGIGAGFGGWSLVTAGDGENSIQMPLSWLVGTPFSNYVIPGFILFTLFGLGSFFTVGVALLRHWTAPYLAFALGVGQMIWISVQLAMMSHLGIFVLQPVMFGWGALIALSAFLWWRTTHRSA